MEKWPNTKVDYNYLARVKQVRMGGSTFSNFLCLFGDLPKVLSMPLVGSDFLSQFIIVINYPGDEMLIIPNEDFYLKDNLFSIGMNLNVSEKGEIVVEGIWEKSPAEKAGIKVGDRIVSFNSKKAGLGSLLEFQEALMDDTIKIISIEVVGAGKMKSVVLEKTLLF